MSIDSSLRPTVGREIELAQLDAALDALADGAAGCAAVEGEPGIGKTRVLAELRRRGEERGHLVLSGVAAEFERDLPFGVWVDALDAYVASQDLDLGDDELAAILPSLSGSDAGAQQSPADERYRAHRAVRSLLELLAARKPLIIVLDDLHWADGASIELIAALLRRAPDAPVLLALAFRPGQAPERLTAALAVPDARRIRLGPLSETDSALLLTDLDAGAVAAIYRHGGGNPFYLEQLARAGGVGALGAGAAPADGIVPAAVAASLAEEVGALSAPERALLEAAAVAGEPFEPDLAAAIAELEPAAGLDALDGLLALDLLRPTAEPRRFVFRHPLVRRAVYESARGGWRLAAHARAASLLEQRGAAAAERAPHVEHYAAQGDEAAIAVLLEAGAAAAARAPSAATRWYELALPLLPAGDVERQVDVRVALASALRAAGELERCRATLLEAIDLLPPDAARRVELTALCAAVEHWLGNHDEAHRRIERAWEDLSDRDGAAAAILQVERAVDGMYELDFDHAIAMGEGALATAQALGDRPLVAVAASVLALSEAAAGQIPAAREHLDIVLAELERLTDAELAPRVDLFYYLGWTLSYLERYDDAVAYVDRGIAIARATGEGRRLVPMMLVKGFPFEMQGRMAEARELCETAVEATRLSASTHELYWALFELAWAHYYSGDPDGAITACDESIRVDPRMGGATMPSAGGGPGWALGVALFGRGEIDEAERIIHGLGDDSLSHKIPVEKCFDWETLALLEIKRGRIDGADAYARRAEEHAATLDLNLPAAVAGRTRAAVLMAQDKPAEAARAAALSVDRATSAGARLQAALSRGFQGQALAAAGEREEAIAALRAAERELDDCGCIRPRDELRRDLRKLGARSEVRGPATPDDSGTASLTDRERGIADLVTARKTNKEIAAELFLSTKTVETHLRNIFVKLGVSSRVDVARVMERERSAGGVTATAAAPDPDAERLRELGYSQELKRRLHVLDNAAIGFAAISPVVGLYAVVFVGTVVAGPAWVWVLPIALAGQCLLLAVYSELASEFPMAGAAYQWNRRLMGGVYGWFSGWVAICAYAVANTTIAYLGAPWLLTLLGIDATPGRIVLAGMVLVVACALMGACGVVVLGRAVKFGIGAEAIASVGIGVALLLAFRAQHFSLLTHTLGAEALSDGSVGAGMLAALAVGGWVFIGFDACVGASEETTDAARHVPRAIWIALLSVAALVMLNAVAATLAHPDPASVVAGEDVDPVTTAVVTSFGSWSTKPFAAVVLVAFLACGTAAQALTARAIYSIARDDVLPASGFLKRVDRRGTPLGAVLATTVIASLGLLLGLHTAAVGSLIAFGTAAIYVSFFLVALAALIARVRGTWVPSGRVRLGRLGLVINVLAVAWLAFETVNIAWPRESLAPPGAPLYQVWAAPIVLAVIGVAGALYVAISRPQERIGQG